MPVLKTLWMLILAIPAFAATQTFILQQGLDGYTGFEDTTIFAESTNSGGGSAAIFAGRNMAGVVRRALLKADLSAIPTDATVTSVTLELSVNNAPNTTAPNTYALHRLSANWGAGTVVGTMGGGGTGAAPDDGDATWLSSFHNQTLWATPGGDFNAVPSDSVVSGNSGTITTWAGAGLVSDVQGWVDDPSMNFGWIVIGPETTNQRIRRFDSSDATTLQPKLTVVFATPDIPQTSVLGIPGLVATALMLFTLAAVSMRRIARRN